MAQLKQPVHGTVSIPEGNSSPQEDRQIEPKRSLSMPHPVAEPLGDGIHRASPHRSWTAPASLSELEGDSEQPVDDQCEVADEETVVESHYKLPFPSPSLLQVFGRARNTESDRQNHETEAKGTTGGLASNQRTESTGGTKGATFEAIKRKYEAEDERGAKSDIGNEAVVGVGRVVPDAYYCQSPVSYHFEPTEETSAGPTVQSERKRGVKLWVETRQETAHREGTEDVNGTVSSPQIARRIEVGQPDVRNEGSITEGATYNQPQDPHAATETVRLSSSMDRSFGLNRSQSFRPVIMTPTTIEVAQSCFLFDTSDQDWTNNEDDVDEQLRLEVTEWCAPLKPRDSSTCDTYGEDEASDFGGLWCVDCDRIDGELGRSEGCAEAEVYSETSTSSAGMYLQEDHDHKESLTTSSSSSSASAEPTIPTANGALEPPTNVKRPSIPIQGAVKMSQTENQETESSSGDKSSPIEDGEVTMVGRLVVIWEQRIRTARAAAVKGEAGARKGAEASSSPSSETGRANGVSSE
ncbi:hypothetical protein BJ508DRAFT_367124 [Ascobolus immersus RN42]|uniref:Uncharacterized protein n=1 Tax=Ascobolus immersus RN42 TaxID=1160509 RepID=A0A3N4HJ64_ASCIM|nr:hypothetical protein BJ508DRAFT_367124 [Ascobolus immersus RN42]